MAELGEYYALDGVLYCLNGNHYSPETTVRVIGKAVTEHSERLFIEFPDGYSQMCPQGVGLRPETPDAVDAYLRSLGYDPDEVVARMRERIGNALERFKERNANV